MNVLLWRPHGYGVKQKWVKMRRLGVSENGIVRRRAESMNEVWCWDFIHDRDERGRVLRWLVIEDEFTREGLDGVRAKRHAISWAFDVRF